MVTPVPSTREKLYAKTNDLQKNDILCISSGKRGQAIVPPAQGEVSKFLKHLFKTHL